MRILLTGGGTGGHIIPNIALIEELRERDKDVQLLYVGAKNGSDKAVISQCNIEFKGIHCGKLRRYFSFENLMDFFKIPVGVVQAFTIISRFSPDVIFSKGGFVSVPVVVAGWLARRRIIIHESDVVPGLANKICALFANDICVAFEDTVKFFRCKKARIHVTGNPVRKEVKCGKKGNGYAMTKFNRDLPVVLVMGGSQGAQQLNVLVWRSLKKLLPICQIIHICGKDKKGVALESLQFQNYCQYEFLEKDLPHLYAISDLVVGRAGANSLAEIALLKKPSVLVPLPLSASRGDQIHNARVFKKLGVSIVLDPDRVNADEFTRVITELVTRKSKLNEMEKSFEGIGENDAVQKIVDLMV